MDRRTFLGVVGTTSVASAAALHLPFEELGYTACLDLQRTMAKEHHDIVLSRSDLKSVASLSQKLYLTRQTVGYGNFNLLDFDEMYRVGKEYSAVGAFTKAELDLFESIFYENAARYGFYGEKVFTSLTESIRKDETVKISHTGHYLYKGRAVEMYEKIRKDIGDTMILTSGVRSVVKQMDLFLRKVVRSRGNVSVASRSLAPAGYSFHGVGDFDVGKVGMGNKNFTSAFAETDEFKKLIDSGYVQIRYPRGNPFGVRYEPWHIKVV